MNCCTITPDRGDRPALLLRCMYVLDKMGLTCEDAIVINYPPISDKIDLIARIKMGIEIAKENKFEFAFIIENDDFYPAGYLGSLSLGYLIQNPELDFIGWQNTFYYNIKTRRYSRLEHETHSSLFCTGFRLSALDDFEWPPDDYPFLDIALWKHAKQSGKNWKLLRTDNPCVGIKGHGMGKMGGKGHRMELMRADPEMKWFREKLNDEEAFKFYQSIV